MGSLDVAGAFATASHFWLVDILQDFEVDTYTRHLLHQWTSGRTSTLRRKTPQWIFYGPCMPIPAGLRRGGFPSPLRRATFFNGMYGEWEGPREAQGDDCSAYMDLIFADGVTTIITWPRPEQLRGRLGCNATNVEGATG